MNYNLQDPYDISLLEYDFSSISEKEWQAYIDYASEADNWKRFSKKALYIGLNNAGSIYKVSHKQMNWALSVAKSINNEIAKVKRNGKTISLTAAVKEAAKKMDVSERTVWRHLKQKKP